jgi:hypothetical protein
MYMLPKVSSESVLVEAKTYSSEEYLGQWTQMLRLTASCDMVADIGEIL